MQGRLKIPSWATIIGWLGAIGTILGILAYFFGDFRTMLGLNKEPDILSQQEVIATLSAMQNDKDNAELQLTQIAVANQGAANEATSTANAQILATAQAQLDAANAAQDAFVSTQNAIAGATATQSAIETQAALDAAASAAAQAQVTLTPTPEPTATPIPEVVSDYRAVVGGGVQFNNKGEMEFTLQANDRIPDQTGLSYVWMLDTDINAATGLSMQDIGVDTIITLKFEGGAWLGTVRAVNSDGTLGEPLLFVDIKVTGNTIQATLDPTSYGLPGTFLWVARAETNGTPYQFTPSVSHNTFTP
jgi:hypothetical protein